MAFAAVVFVVTNFLALDPTAADTISCTSPEQCHHSHIHCASNESCFVSCTGRDSCRNSTIHCPITGDCTVHCRGSDSCWDSVIDASCWADILCRGRLTYDNILGPAFYDVTAGNNLNADILEKIEKGNIKL
eukprot:736087_1